MSRFFLIRHGMMDGINERIYGRTDGVHLNETGRAQAQKLAAELAVAGIEAVYSSPLDRAQETAAAICARLNLPLQTESAFNEIDVGEWTGRTFAELDGNPEWDRFNRFRSNTGAPGGELMLAAQLRAVAGIERLRKQHGVVGVVSHGDVIRALVAHFLGFNLDFIFRIRIDPASISILEVDETGAQFTLVNGSTIRKA
jgi:broad specificity phosphatase PhoE